MVHGGPIDVLTGDWLAELTMLILARTQAKRPGGGYARTFRELMETTQWDRYGPGRHPKCANCMTHCGYEPSAVEDSTASLGNVVGSLRSTVG